STSALLARGYCACATSPSAACLEVGARAETGLSLMPTADRIPIPSGAEQTYGLLDFAAGASSAVLMVAGAGGGLSRPSGIYEDLAVRLARGGIAALRLEYRRPNSLGDCITEVHAALDALQQRGVAQIVLVGWSFGGAVAIAAGAASEMVVGVATTASQTYGTAAVRFLAPKPLLLIHGTH